MTDNEIISIDDAIRHCYETYYERDDLCRECRDEHKQLAKWLEELKESRNTINHQRAEIERLKKKNTILSKNADTAFQDGLDENRDLFKKEVEPEIRNEAIKEFVGKLTDNLNRIYRMIEDTEKEMTEEK